MALFQKANYNLLVEDIKRGAVIQFKLPGQIFDERNKGTDYITQNAHLIFSLIMEMRDKKKRNMLIMGAGGESQFQDLYTRLHMRLKDLYNRALSRTNENIISLQKEYVIMERKYGGPLGVGKGNVKADYIRYRLADAKSFLDNLKRNQSYVYISKWDTSGEVNFNYQYALTTISGAYKNLKR